MLFNASRYTHAAADGVMRLSTPDFGLFANAYAANDVAFFEER